MGKLLGLGTVTKVDGAKITLVTNITPPARSRTLIDQTALDEELATNALGIEEHSEFTFNQFWIPGDSQHQSMDTLFNSKALAEFKIEYTNAPAVVDTFSGKVSRLAPQAIERGGMLMREVTIQRYTNIARA